MKIKEALKNKFYENNGELRDYFVVLKGENGEKVGKYITFDDMLAITEDNYQKYRDYKDDQYGTELENLFVSARKLIPVDGGVTFKDKAGKYYNTKVVKEDKSVVLPRHAGVSRQIRLGIIGFPNCGKTVLEYQFNTILRPEFARNVPGFRILSDMLDFSRPRLEMEEKAMELSGGTLPDPNKKEEVSSTLSFMVKYKNQEILLEFQDVSGEEATLGRNLFYDAYIILISAEELMKENCSDDLENSITNLLYETFERQGGENIPVFVGITKSDLLQADEHLSKEMKDILAQNSLKKIIKEKWFRKDIFMDTTKNIVKGKAKQLHK